MLGEYKVNRSTRRCHALNRPLKDGEWYYSVVFEDGDDYVRRDYSLESWSGPPENSIGHWKCRMPTADQRKLVPAPNAVLVDLLRQMETMPAKAKNRYLLALILLRRKVAKQLPSTPGDSVLALEISEDGSRIDVDVCDIDATEQQSLRDELQELLYCEADPDD